MHHLDPVSIEKIIRAYIPEKLIPPNWTCDQGALCRDLRNLLSEANNALRLFEDEEELFTSLKYFSLYPGNLKLFGIEDPEDLFRFEGFTFKSLKNKEYAYIGYYFHNFHQLAQMFLEGFDTRLVYETIVLYLKCLYSQVKNYAELVPRDQCQFCSLRGIFIDFMESLADEDHKKIDDPKKFARKCIRKLRETGSEGFESEFQDILDKSFQTLSIKKNGISYYKMYAAIDYAIAKLDGLYKSLVSQLQTDKPAIRVFSLSDKYCVLSQEISRAFKRVSADGSRIKIKVAGELSETRVFELNDLAEAFGKKVMNSIEFVKVSIPTFKLSLAMVPLFDGGCLVQSDKAVGNIMTRMIVIDKVFQGMRPEQFVLIKQFYDSMIDIITEIHFVNYNFFQSLIAKWDTYFDTHFKNTGVTRKEVRDVDETRGFTLEDIKNELEYLEVTEVFPEIFEHAEKFYSESMQHESAKFDTRSFIYAVWVCQNNCLMARLTSTSPVNSKVSETAQRREAIVSENSTRNEATLRRSAHSDSRNTESIKKSLNSSVSQYSQNEPSDGPPSLPSSQAIEDSVSDTEISPKPAHSEMVSVDAPHNQKKKRVKKPKAFSQKPEDVKPAAPESKACDKCFKSSESFRDANAKLKLSKEESKQMRKDLVESDLKAEQLEEVVRKLKEKLHQKNVELYDMAQEKEKLEQELSDKNSIIEVMQAEAAVPVAPPPIVNVPASDDTKEALLKLLSIRNSIQFEKPIKQSTEVFNRVIGKSKKEEFKETANLEYFRFEVSGFKRICKSEMEAYHEKCEAYQNSVDTQINQILATPTIADDSIIPEFPEFSEKFKGVYKKVMRSEAPKICEPLLKNLDCSICAFSLSYPLETIKCAKCNEVCHLTCAKEWFKKGSTSCPICRGPMNDDKEFPKLS